MGEEIGQQEWEGIIEGHGWGKKNYQHILHNI